jgi:hypothetical protein
MKGDLAAWEPSPRGIADEEAKSRFLGDVRYGTNHPFVAMTLS